MGRDLAAFGEANTRFMKPEYLQDEKLIVKISEVEIGSQKVANGSEEEQIILHFADHEKVLGLNKTNTRSLFQAAGTTDEDLLVGKSLTLFPTFDKNPSGKQVPVIRIEPVAPRGKAASAKAAPASDVTDEDIPF